MKTLDYKTRLYDIIFHSDTEFAELVSVVGLLCWGLWVILPFKTFYVGEWVLGCLIIFVSFLQFDNLMEGTRDSRTRGNFMAFLGWLIVFITAMSGAIREAGFLVYAGMCIFSGISYYNLNKKHE